MSDVLHANDLAMHALPLHSRGYGPEVYGAVLWNNILGFTFWDLHLGIPTGKER